MPARAWWSRWARSGPTRSCSGCARNRKAAPLLTRLNAKGGWLVLHFPFASAGAFCPGNIEGERPMTQNITFDRALIEKYDRPGPRYTSYPTAPQFHQEIGRASCRERV